MKLFLIGLMSLVLFTACGSKSISVEIAPEKSLTTAAHDSFKIEIIRFVGKLPGKANHASKFDTTYDTYYATLAEQHKLEFYHIDENNHYFLLSRIAPSLDEKYVAIGGKLKRNAAGEIEYFEEVFRTWKMPSAEMKTTAEMLFRKMIHQEDLSPYYTENTKDEFIIEFPDKDVQYNVEQRRWISKLENPMESLYKIEEQTARDMESNK